MWCDKQIEFTVNLSLYFEYANIHEPFKIISNLYQTER
jgi:hypothetical protein